MLYHMLMIICWSLILLITVIIVVVVVVVFRISTAYFFFLVWKFVKIWNRGLAYRDANRRSISFRLIIARPLSQIFFRLYFHNFTECPLIGRINDTNNFDKLLNLASIWMINQNYFSFSNKNKLVINTN